MLFNTFQFALFFAALFVVYWRLPHRAQNVLLLAASYYFYACWDYRFLSLLILSTLMDYGCGLAVDRIRAPRARKLFVGLSMALNLGFLGTFKYYNFFAESLQAALARVGWHVPLAGLNVVLPIGISFYTFQSMSYVIDVYRGHLKPTRSLLQFRQPRHPRQPPIRPLADGPRRPGAPGHLRLRHPDLLRLLRLH
jgi:D-alanyl-lipoteichoic acid acyltransferase DltB (MBOAT superfamily)